MSEATTPSQNQAPSKYSITNDVKLCCNGRHPLELSTDFNLLAAQVAENSKVESPPAPSGQGGNATGSSPAFVSPDVDFENGICSKSCVPRFVPQTKQSSIWLMTIR